MEKRKYESIKMAKEESTKIVLERTYNVPLRKEYQKVPNWKRTKKAVKALREFLVKHMKSEQVKLGKALNEKLWRHGIRNPPHHVKVTVTKDERGKVQAELFGEAKPVSKKKSEKKKNKTKEPAKVADQKEEHSSPETLTAEKTEKTSSQKE